jgi:hypothetical protein
MALPLQSIWADTIRHIKTKVGKDNVSGDLCAELEKLNF